MAFGRAHRIWGASLAGWLLVIASCGSRPLLYGGASGVHSPSGGAGGGGLGSGGAPGAGVGGISGASGTGGGTTGGAGGSPSAGSGGGAGGGPPGPGAPAAPRLIAPLSTSTVTSQRPTLRWALAAGTDGARVDICRDRACTKPLVSFDAAGASGVPPRLLPAGLWFWRAFGKSAGATGTAVSPTWEVIVRARSAPVDTSWGTTPDVNGDGATDVLVGAIGGDGGAGRAYAYESGPVGLPKVPTVTLTGVGPGADFGGSLASAGDVNGDGFSDVVVGAIGAAGTGQVYLYLGGPTGLNTSPTTTITGGDGFAANFGGSVAGAGDVNGDGYADVLVGAYSASSGTGRAYLYWGSATGLSTSPAVTLNGD